jgi:hypothetical protein
VVPEKPDVAPLQNRHLNHHPAFYNKRPHHFKHAFFVTAPSNHVRQLFTPSLILILLSLNVDVKPFTHVIRFKRMIFWLNVGLD